MSTKEVGAVDPTQLGASLVETLQTQTEYWQSVLGLADWHVHVYPVPANHPKLGGGIGACEYTMSRRDAVIRVCRPLDLPSKTHEYLDGEECDYDLTLVHELLHLHFAPFAAADETTEGLAQEQAINAVSKAMVGLYRENQGVVMEKHQHVLPEGIAPDVAQDGGGNPPTDHNAPPAMKEPVRQVSALYH